MEGDLFFNMPGSENSAVGFTSLFGNQKSIKIEIASVVFNIF